MSKLYFYLVFVPVIRVVNAIRWVWCKLTGKEFTQIGGPQ